MKALIISILISGFIMAQQIVELKQPNSSKIVVKFMFTNGSVTDAAGKEGLTYTTAQLITQGGTGNLTYSDLQDKIYPMAADYFSLVDKEVVTFTFLFHKDWIEEFYPIMIGLITNPSLSQADFDRVKKNQQAYVDQVIRASSDEEYSKKALEDFLFRGTNYQHMPTASSSLQATTRPGTGASNTTRRMVARRTATRPDGSRTARTSSSPAAIATCAAPSRRRSGRTISAATTWMTLRTSSTWTRFAART